MKEVNEMRFQGILLCFVLASLVSGCLKTRTQLRDDPADTEPAASAPTPVKVQEVQAHGAEVIDEIKTEITRLNGRLEEVERSQGQASQDKAGGQELRTEVKKLGDRIRELEEAQAQMLEAIQKIRAATPAQADPELFDRAKSQFNQGDFSGAIETLNAYLKAPKVPHQQEAIFLRAEAFFNSKQYKKAIVDYSKFPEKFTSSRHTPSALYKIGLSFENLGMKDDARSFYQELAEKFPKTTEGKRAKAKLK